LEDLSNFIILTEKLYSDVNKYVLGFGLGAPLASLISTQKENYFKGLVFLNPTYGIDSGDNNKWSKLVNLVGSFITSINIIKCKSFLI
jgi:hypothetical protein